MADQKIVWGGIAVVVVASLYFVISSSGVSDVPSGHAIETQNNSDNNTLADPTSGTLVLSPDRLARGVEQRGIAHINRNGNVSYQSANRIPRTSSQQAKGADVVRHLGEKLDPETYVGEGAPKLIALGERLDPEKVYPDSGAQQLQLVGERIDDVENYIAEGAETLKRVGERIPPSEVR